MTAKHDFEREPVFVKAAEPREVCTLIFVSICALLIMPFQFNAEEYAENFSATFVSSATSVNLLADVPLGSLALLRHEARTTLDTSGSDDSFDEVFLKDKCDLGTRFDMVLQ